MIPPRSSGSGKSWIQDVLIVVSLSAVARLALFSGFIGGDDFAYAWAANEILTRGYPEIGGNVFAARPLLIAPMAASIGLLGWSETALVLPVLLASLWGIGCTYAIGRLLAGRAAGLVASLTLAVFPLDLVYATTTTNDIAGSAVFATTALLALTAVRASSRERTSVALVAGAAAGIAAGLAPAVKVSMLVGWIPFAIVMAAVVAVQRHAWRPVLAMLSGWACVQLALALFFWQTSGEWFKNYTVELGFNRTFLAEPYLATRTDALWSYPSWIFGLRPAMPDTDRFFPYGLFFPLAAISAAACLRWCASRTWFLIVWCLGILLLLEFWPLQVYPAYIPIHRLPRFLHLAAVPGALLIGQAYALASRRGPFVHAGTTVALLIYGAHAIASSLTAVERHQDSMKDLRFAAEVSSPFAGPIVTDAEMRGYLFFRRGFDRTEQLSRLVGANARVPPNSMVIVGGGRRIDMDPNWVERRVPQHVPDSWTKLAALPGLPRPWRKAQGAVYVTHARSAFVSRGSTDVIGSQACPPGSGWRLVDTIDVGEPGSETAHSYEIEGQTFLGERMMFDRNDLELEDDGRAFKGHQAFETAALVPGVAACLVKRIDPSARRQVSRWSVAQRTVGEMSADRDGGASWLIAMLRVPPEFIRESSVRIREDFIAADVDVNSYRIEIYQAR